MSRATEPSCARGLDDDLQGRHIGWHRWIPSVQRPTSFGTNPTNPCRERRPDPTRCQPGCSQCRLQHVQTDPAIRIRSRLDHLHVHGRPHANEQGYSTSKRVWVVTVERWRILSMIQWQWMARSGGCTHSPGLVRGRGPSFARRFGTRSAS